jgi:hydroxyacylglutathione hydrolase
MNRILVNSVVVSPFATNCYLVREQNKNSCVIVDPGGDPDVIIFQLSELNLKPAAILITHGHIDHVMALSEINPNNEIPVYAHIEEKSLLEKVALQGQMFGLPEMVTPEVSNWIDKEDINIDGLNFKVIHTPGHSPGGCCYQLESEIFVGDTLFESSIGRTDLPGGNYDQLIHSIKTKLFILSDEMIVYPGHGDQTTIDHEKKYNPFLRGEL